MEHEPNLKRNESKIGFYHFRLFLSLFSDHFVFNELFANIKMKYDTMIDSYDSHSQTSIGTAEGLYGAHSGSKWHHTYKMAATGKEIFWLHLFIVVDGDASSIYRVWLDPR